MTQLLSNVMKYSLQCAERSDGPSFQHSRAFLALHKNDIRQILYQHHAGSLCMYVSLCVHSAVSVSVEADCLAGVYVGAWWSTRHSLEVWKSKRKCGSLQSSLGQHGRLFDNGRL